MSNNYNFTDAITRLPDIPKDSSDYKKITHLELVSKDKVRYQLVNIDQFEREEYKKIYKYIVHLNINDNNISILKLKGYNALDTLLASNNQISTVDLNLPSLLVLDLSKNNIRKMFELINLPSLRELVLCQNSISEISYDTFKSVKRTLTKLDLSENLVQFSNVKEFFNFTETFGPNMKELAVLQLDKNSFTGRKQYKDYYQHLIKASFPKLQVLNFRDVGLKVNKEEINVKIIKEKMLELEKSEGGILSTTIRKSEIIDLKAINKKLLKINQLGRLNDKTLEELEEMIDSYMSSIGGANKGIDKGQSDEEELDDFEIFLDYIEKIIDSFPDYEKRLYSIIGKFSTIKYGKFTSRSLSCIKQRISGENSKEIVEVLSEVHTFLKRETEENIPVNVIDSLQLFLDEPIFVNPMKTLLKRIMTIGQKIDNDINYNANSTNNIDLIYLKLYCSVISFIATAIQYQDFVNEITTNEQFISASAVNLKKILSENDDHIIDNPNILLILRNLLFIIRVMCIKQITEQTEEDNKDKDKDKDKEKDNKQNKSNCINLIVGFGIRDRIEQKLRLLLQSVYKKTNFEDNTKDMAMRQVQLRKKQECTSLIQCYGALLSGANDVSKFLDKNSLAMKIIDILGQNEIVAPLLIHGACDFTYFLLLNKQMTKNEERFNIIAAKLYNFRCLIPYLFPSRPEFHTICAIAEKFGDKTCDRGKPIELPYMNSEIINNLIISITRLMSFFGKNAQIASPIQKKCKDICLEMNNLKRDTALTNCLLLPNEDVKLSIVECFFSIEVEQLEPEELTSIYKQLSYLSSINGKMIKIVAIIFILMNKWFLFNLQKKNYAKIETCKEAIFLAMNLLYKNDLKKKSFNSKGSMKNYLSAVLVMFLINVSNFEYTKKYFSDPKNTVEMNKVLQMEEESVNSMVVGFPLEIEKCHCGWSISNIFTAIRSGMINPYTYVSLRVMIHLGDVLFNKKYPLYEIDYHLSSEEIMISIGEEMKKREKDRIKEEEFNWREVKETLKKKKYKYAISLTKKERENEQKYFVKNFKDFLNFILCQCSQKQISQLSRVWENKFSEDIDRIKYSTFENPKEERDENDGYLIPENEDESDKEEDQDGNKSDKEKENDEQKEEENIYDKFKNFLRQEDYDVSSSADTKFNITFNNIQNELFHFVRYGCVEELKRDSEEETPNNPYLRSLFISSFFRCIYAVLEYPEDQAIKDSMIKQLYFDENIKKLCQLADCTKFAENNIATKFLIIMRHVLRNSKIFHEMSKENDKKDQKYDSSSEFLKRMGCISYMIKKIVRVFKKDLNIEKDEHKILFSEVCQCSAIIISQMQMMKFVSDKVREKSISTMIDYEVINVCVLVIKEYMNKEADVKGLGGQSANSFGTRLLNEMVLINANIIGEYMSRCPSRKYDILENFTRGYMFERCKMRKSLIKEIIECSQTSIVKSNLSSSLNNIMINIIAPVYITNYRKKTSKLRMLIVTDISFEFVEIANETEIFNLGYFNVDENAKILISDINAVICFDYLNRMIIQTKDNEFGFFFYKMSISSQIKSILSEINNKIRVYEGVKTFGGDIKDAPLEKKLMNKIAALGNSETKNDYVTLNEEEKNPETPTTEAPKEKGEPAPPVDPDAPKITIINCLFEVSNFCDFLKNLFKKVELIKNAKVVVIKEEQIEIYEEKFEEWENINARELFDRASGHEEKANGLNLGTFEHCFNFLTQYDKGEFVSMKLVDADHLYLKRNGGSYIAFDIVDDMSYVKFKQALSLTEEFDEFDNN